MLISLCFKHEKIKNFVKNFQHQTLKSYFIAKNRKLPLDNFLGLIWMNLISFSKLDFFADNLPIFSMLV